MMLDTKRLIIRPFDCNDLDIILKLYSNEEIMKYIPLPVMNHSMAQNQLNKNITEWKREPRIHYEMAVIYKETGEKIGRAEITRNYSEDSAMIGWMLIKNVWGKGFATEIAKALIEYCFQKIHIHRVYALCHPNNTASWKVMEKCGLHREAHFIKKCKYTKTDGDFWEDELEYAMIRPD